MNTASTSSAQQQQDSGAGQQSWPGADGAGPLQRPIADRMVAGVAAGVARYLGVDPAIIRIVLVVLVFVGGAGLPLYLAGWLLIPEEGAQRSIAAEFLSRPGGSR
ncbi:MAG: PspC domain-containing protein [Streptosporangiaceae bacterium]